MTCARRLNVAARFSDEQGADFRKFLLDEELPEWPTGKNFRRGLDEDSPFKKSEARRGQRAGILTHPYMLSVLCL